MTAYRQDGATTSHFAPPPRGAAVGAAVAAAVSAAGAEAFGPQLSFLEAKELVEATSPDVFLELDSQETSENGRAAKGRFLVAKRSIAAGEVLLSEWPLFTGSMDGGQSRQVFQDSFLMQEDLEIDEDCAHPCSSLVDCIAGILRAKRTAVAVSCDQDEVERAVLRLRKLSTLCHSPVEDSRLDQIVSDILVHLTPEYRELISEEDLQRIIRILSNNRFGGTESHLDVMFAGSMFEHSCAPNCFLGGTWRARFVDKPRQYRALRDIKAGEALSIDYLQLPDSYLPTAGRAATLAGWGFVCSCARCTALPEVTRAFMCPACGLPQLCPLAGSDTRLVCQACGAEPERDYAARCLAAEATLRSCREGIPLDSTVAASYEGLISDYHHMAFELAWESWSRGPDIDLDTGIDVESIEQYMNATDQVIDCILHLYGDPMHPLLLPMYHRRAVLQQGDLDGQREFLEMEHQLLQRFYPEEAEMQDSEIMHMVSRTGPPNADSGNSTADGPSIEEVRGVCNQQAALGDAEGLPRTAFDDFSLSGMD